ncbi:helix-turn-helix transcriptional regulator [Sedimentitalea nanhaiensis]|uniref:Predicted DNA-binding transcriptional regulator YafY, contains an HTH and WYL domains n=1 Tax=Sedimentitalea nanhaiensis TaxID=999627 RepID=A0A1I7D071_9RHOB|nr:YafY family protein [Sedimentitalea nanhaiensis]SFU05064.1 Predicted DNA-binding transcriptional regulator YafY, contains an HTH and WYL domains [Sedimentitalea nanhaiensis]
MPRSDRLLDLIALLRDGQLHRASDLAERMGVSQRTIYRDMERLIASGVPVQGTRGTGYRTLDRTTLPPLTLTRAEVDALTLGIAIVSEAADPDLKSAALSLSDKIEASLSAETLDAADAWKAALTPLADSARGLSHMASLRSAIAGKQKFRLGYRSSNGILSIRTVRPLRLESWGHIWILISWCELREDFREFRTDLIETATPLPELFVDEPGKRLADYLGMPGPDI